MHKKTATRIRFRGKERGRGGEGGEWEALTASSSPLHAHTHASSSYLAQCVRALDRRAVVEDQGGYIPKLSSRTVHKVSGRLHMRSALAFNQADLRARLPVRFGPQVYVHEPNLSKKYVWRTQSCKMLEPGLGNVVERCEVKILAFEHGDGVA